MFTNICWGKQRADSRLFIYFWFLEAGLLADLADCPLPNDGFASRCPWLLLADLLLTSIFRANDAQRREWYYVIAFFAALYLGMIRTRFVFSVSILWSAEKLTSNRGNNWVQLRRCFHLNWIAFLLFGRRVSVHKPAFVRSIGKQLFHADLHSLLIAHLR